MESVTTRIGSAILGPSGGSPLPCGQPLHPAIALEDQTQTLKGQELIDIFDRCRLWCNQFRVSSGCDHPGRFAPLLDNAIDQTINQRRVAVDQTGLDGTDGGPANG